MAAAWQSCDVIAVQGRRIDNMDRGFWIRIQDHRLRTSIKDQDQGLVLRTRISCVLCITWVLVVVFRIHHHMESLSNYILKKNSYFSWIKCNAIYLNLIPKRNASSFLVKAKFEICWLIVMSWLLIIDYCYMLLVYHWWWLLLKNTFCE